MVPLPKYGAHGRNVSVPQQGKKQKQQLRTSRPRGRRRPDDPQCPEQYIRASIGRCYRLRRLRFDPCCAVGSPDTLGQSGWRASGFVRFVFSHHAVSFS